MIGRVSSIKAENPNSIPSGKPVRLVPLVQPCFHCSLIKLQILPLNRAAFKSYSSLKLLLFELQKSTDINLDSDQNMVTGLRFLPDTNSLQFGSGSCFVQSLSVSFIFYFSLLVPALAHMVFISLFLRIYVIYFSSPVFLYILKSWGSQCDLWEVSRL